QACQWLRRVEVDGLVYLAGQGRGGGTGGTVSRPFLAGRGRMTGPVEGPPSISRWARRRARSRKSPRLPGRRPSFRPPPGPARRTAGAPSGPPGRPEVPRPRRTSRLPDRRSPRRPEPRNPSPPPPRRPRSTAPARRQAEWPSPRPSERAGPHELSPDRVEALAQRCGVSREHSFAVDPSTDEEKRTRTERDRDGELPVERAQGEHRARGER